MNFLFSFFMLAVLALPRASYADTYVNICSRGIIGEKIASAAGARCNHVSVEAMSNIRRLSVYNWDLTAIPAYAFQGLTSLEELDLSNNKLTEIPTNAFQGLASLRHLYLSRNDITEILENAFQGLFLTALYLEQNKVKQLSRSHTGLSNWAQVYGARAYP